jgi:DNA-binding NarL/FixJ family response regulator
MAAGEGVDSGDALSELTDRQLEVARLISDGLTDKQIAAALGVTKQRIGQIVDSIRGKLNLPGNRNTRTLIAQQFPKSA